MNSPVIGTLEKLPVLSAFAPRKLSSFAVLAGSPSICGSSDLHTLDYSSSWMLLLDLQSGRGAAS